MSGEPKQSYAKQAAGQQQQAVTPAPAVKLPATQTPKQAQGCPGTSQPSLSCDAVIARASEDQATAALSGVDVAWVGLFVALVTVIVAGIAAKFARDAAAAATKSYTAFVAAEDANLFVEFIDGSLVESFSEGRRQPDTYFFNVRFTNIGRSTARLHFFTKGQQSIAVEQTLKTGESVEVREPLEVESLKKFRIMVWYASPIRPSACQIVTAVPFLQKDAPGGVAATVYSSELFNLDEKHPE